MKENIHVTLADDREFFNGQLTRKGLNFTVQRKVMNRLNINDQMEIGEIRTPSGKVRVYRFNPKGAWFIDAVNMIHA